VVCRAAARSAADGALNSAGFHIIEHIMAYVLEARQLVKQYPQVRAVDGVSFEVEEASCFGLLGRNGAGKSTTIEMLEGLLQPTSGPALFRGAPLGSHYRERIGIQFQSTALQEHLTTPENLRFFSELYPRHWPLEQLGALCGLEEFLDRDASKLSGGQRQRLLLAIASASSCAHSTLMSHSVRHSTSTQRFGAVCARWPHTRPRVHCRARVFPPADSSPSVRRPE